MKRFVLPLLGAFCLTTGGIALADDPATTPDPVPADGPCKKVIDACKAGGFVKGAHKEGKGLFKDCVQPLLDGKTVTGVTVTPEDVAACKAAPKPAKPAPKP